MKLLLDEQIPARLVREFPSRFEVMTVQNMGWSSTKNGALLRLAAEAEFAAILSADKNMRYQQNADELPIPVIILEPGMNRLSDLIPLIPSVLKILDQDPLLKFYRIDQ